jgi:hypothetical protein
VDGGFKVEVKHIWENAEYLFIKNVCSEDELRLCKNELEILSYGLETPEKTGSGKHENGKLKKENKGIFFGCVYVPKFGDYSPCTKVIEKVIKVVRAGNYTPHSIFNYIAQNIVSYQILFSAYSNNDYYEAHRDATTLTFLFWLKNKNFTGGDLKFTDFNEEVLFEDNSVIIFPSHYQHEVSKVDTSEDGYVRYVVSAFLTPVGLPIETGTSNENSN